MKHRKRETGSGVSTNKSNIALAMRVRMPKIPEIFAPQELPAIQETAPEQQIITTEVLIAPPPTNNQSELTIPSTSAPAAALELQVQPRATKRTRKSAKYYGYDKDDSSGESTNSFPPNFVQPRRKRRAGDVESVQPSIVQKVVDTASRVEPIENEFPSPITGQVSPKDPRIRTADHNSSN